MKIRDMSLFQPNKNHVNVVQRQQKNARKKWHSIALCLVFGIALLSAPVTFAASCQSNTSSGNWSAAASWTNCGGTTPQTTDTVQIVNGHTITIDGSARTISGLQIDAGGTLANGGFLVTVTGTGSGVNGFTINGTLSGSGGVTLSGSGATIDGSGIVSATGTTTLSTNKTIAATADITFAGTISLSSGVTITNNGTVTTTGTGGITGGASSSTWTQGTNATLNFAGSTTSLLSTGTLTATATGNTVNYSGDTQTCKNTTYYHLSFSGSGTKSCSATTVSGNYSVSGTAARTMSASTSIAGDLLVSGGTLTTGAYTFTVSGTTTVSGGTLSITSNTSAKTFVGLVTVSGGTLSGSSTQGIFRGGITQTGSGVVSLTGTTTFNTNAQELNGTLSFAIVTVTGVTVTNYGTVTISSTFSGTGGWTQGMDSTVRLGGSTTSAASITTLNATASGNTVEYMRSGTQTCKNTTYYHLSFSGTSTKTCAATTVNGDLSLSGTATRTMSAALSVGGNVYVSGGTLTTGAYTFTVSGTTTVSGGTFSISSNTSAKTFVGLVTVSGGTLSGASTQAVFQGGVTQTSGTVSITGTATLNTNAQVLSGAMTIATMTVTGVTVTNNGMLNVTTALSGTGSFVNGSTGTLSYGASSAPTVATFSAETLGNSVDYNRAGTQTCLVTTYHHLSFSGSSAKTCAVTTVNGDVSVSGTASWTTTSAVAIGGGFSVSGGATVTTGNDDFFVQDTTMISGGNVHINGTGAKTFSGEVTVSSGNFDGTAATIFFEGGITNISGTVNMTGSCTFLTHSQTLSGSQTFSTIIVTGVSLYNTNTVTVTTGLFGSGTLVNSANATLSLNATTITITTLDASATENMVVYTNTSSTQTVKSATYHDLRIEKSAQVAVLGGDIVVQGDLDIVSGTFDVGSGLNYAVTISGNYTNSGTFTAHMGTVTFNGSVTQTLSGTMTGSSSFYRLVLTNASGVDDVGCDISFTPGLVFAASATATHFNIETGSVRVQYLSGGVYTFTHIAWDGGGSGTPIFFRNSDLGAGTWGLNVSGGQAISYVNVSRSDASAGDMIVATDGTSVDCGNNTYWNFVAGALSVGIVDASHASVMSPVIVMSVLSTRLSMQTSTGVLGAVDERVRIENATATPAWTVSIAPTLGTTAAWAGSAGSYDLNDPTSGASDGPDLDGVGGQMTINPSTATITPDAGCSTTGLSLGGAASFIEGSIDAITVLSASSAADVMCAWDIVGISVSQTVPPEQPAGNDYAIDMTLTITAS